MTVSISILAPAPATSFPSGSTIMGSGSYGPDATALTAWLEDDQGHNIANGSRVDDPNINDGMWSFNFGTVTTVGSGTWKGTRFGSWYRSNRQRRATVWK